METVLFRLIHMAMNLALSVQRLGNHSQAKGFMQVCECENKIFDKNKYVPVHMDKLRFKRHSFKGTVSRGSQIFYALAPA